MTKLDLKPYGDPLFAYDLLFRVAGGHVVFLAGCPVYWKPGTQALVTLSTMNLCPTRKRGVLLTQDRVESGYVHVQSEMKSKAINL